MTRGNLRIQGMDRGETRPPSKWRGGCPRTGTQWRHRGERRRPRRDGNYRDNEREMQP